MKLTEGVHLSTMRTSSWSPVIYRIRQFEQPRGDLEFKLALARETANWTVSLAGEVRQEMQTYSPALAAADCSPVLAVGSTYSATIGGSV